MEHFLTYSDNIDNFADKITINEYTQGENENKINTTILKSKNILEIVLSNKDYNYQILDNSEKSEYVKIFLIATIFSVLGGIFGYILGAYFFDLAILIIEIYGYEDKVISLKTAIVSRKTINEKK